MPVVVIRENLCQARNLEAAIGSRCGRVPAAEVDTRHGRAGLAGPHQIDLPDVCRRGRARCQAYVDEHKLSGDLRRTEPCKPANRQG